MNKTNLLIISFLFISVFQTSCISTSRFYTANRNPVPLFKKKGDVYIDLSTNMFNKADFTIGYAASNCLGGYIGIAGAYEEQTKESGKGTYDEHYTKYQYNGTLLNGGLGYFLKPEISNQLRFEIFGDFSFGNYENRIESYSIYHGYPSPKTSNFSNGNYHRTGILANVGFTDKSKFLTFGYSAKISNLTFSNATFSNQAFEQKEQQRINYKSDYQILEHAIFGRIGKGCVKFQIQICQYYCFNTSYSKGATDQNNGSIMFGIVISPNILQKK